MKSNLLQITSHCFGLHTQNPGLRKADLEPSPKRASDKMKMLKQGETLKRKQVVQASCTPGKSGKTGKPYQIQGFLVKIRENQGSFCLEGNELGKIRGKVFLITKNVFLQVMK